MEDTCLKDMQATKLSSLKTEKHLQVHSLPKALRSMEWTSLSSGTPSSTLLLSSSSKIFRILTSIGVNPKLSNNTPAARIAWLATFSRFQAASYKLRNFSYMDSSDKQQASSFKPQATSCKQRAPS